MKKYLFVLLFLYTSICFAQDKFAPIGQPFDDMGDDRKHHPVVPEPSSYGLVLIGGAVVWIVYRRFRKR